MNNPVEWWLAEMRAMFEDLVAYAQTIDHPLAAWLVEQAQDPMTPWAFAVFAVLACVGWLVNIPKSAWHDAVEDISAEWTRIREYFSGDDDRA